MVQEEDGGKIHILYLGRDITQRMLKKWQNPMRDICLCTKSWGPLKPISCCGFSPVSAEYVWEELFPFSLFLVRFFRNHF